MKTLRLLFIATSMVSFASMASAALNLSISFTPVSSEGTDPNGFVDSTWTFLFTINQPTYDDYFGNAAVFLSEAALTIAGADNDNGAFSASGSYTMVPNAGGLAALGADFSFGSPSIAVTEFQFVGTPVVSPAPQVGDAIEASDFDGLVVNSNAVTIDGESYNFGSGTFTVVPESSTWAAIAGLGALGLAIGLRRHVAA